MQDNREEIDKISNRSVRKLENTLLLINDEEIKLLDEFDKNIIKVLGDSFIPILNYYKNNPPKGEVLSFAYRNEIITVPKHFLLNFHFSYIFDLELRNKYLESLKKWFSDKTNTIKNSIKDKDNYANLELNIPISYALASLALTSFHRRDRMYLRDVQKLAALSIAEGNISELATGEGKTLSAVLPLYLFALRGKGSHLITANSYLAERDFEETRPIYEGLGLTSGYLPEDITDIASIYGYDKNNLNQSQIYDLQQKIFRLKKEAYKKDITYGSKSTYAFDYLRDCSVKKLDQIIQRVEKPGFALIDEIDDALIDDALTPYRISGSSKVYINNMSILDLSMMYGVKYDDLLSKCKSIGTNEKKLSYEEARHIVSSVLADEILPDDNLLLEIANNFFKMQMVKEIDKKTFDEVENSDLYDSSLLQEQYQILYSRGLKKYKITDNCMEDFLKYSYLALRINSLISLVEKDLVQDDNYLSGKDYYLVENRLKLTLNGAYKLLRDKNYSTIYNDFQKYIRNLSAETTMMTHYLNQVIIANLLMVKDEDYTLHFGSIKPVKNGRIEEGSRFSGGLHQALEIKEGIPREKRTKETSTFSSITQRNFYQRYDMYAGMTGTSSKKLFKDVYGKETTVIPKNAFYEYYQKKNGLLPRNIDKKGVKFTLEDIDKYSLIMSSVKESVKNGQPVLLVVSDTSEIPSLANLLTSYKYTFQVLNLLDDKEEEALKLSQAGLPGMITISTAMAGRGTDIKLGGDRDTLIEILKERHIRDLEEQYQKKLNFSVEIHEELRKKVEKSYLDSGNIWTKKEEIENQKRLEQLGLKIISSGYFETERIDRQLEGRTGRNGLGGSTERYASLKDIKRLGLNFEEVKNIFIKADKNKDFSLNLEPNYERKLVEEIKTKQRVNEENIKSNIVYSQKVNEYSVNMIEEYRQKRREILTNPSDNKIRDLLEISANSLIAKHFSLSDLKHLSINVLDCKDLNLNELTSEIKEMVGISLQKSFFKENEVSIRLLRDIIIVNGLKKIKNRDEKMNILLDQNDYVIENIPYLIELTQGYKSMVTISGGFDSVLDPLTTINFFDNKELLGIESSIRSLRKHIGKPISKEEFYQKELKEELSYHQDGDDYEVVVDDNNFLSKYRLLKNSREKASNINVSNSNIKGLVDSKLGRFMKLLKKNAYDGLSLKKDQKKNI